MINAREILKQKWMRGKIEFVGKRSKTGLIKSEDGDLLIEFDEHAPTTFDQLNENDTVLFTLANTEPDERGILKAEKLLSVKQK
jgi:cold shock CspA family protein